MKQKIVQRKAAESDSQNQKKAETVLPKRKKLNKLDLFLSFFLAVKFSTSPSYIQTGDCELNLSVLASILLHFVFFFLIFHALKWALDAALSKGADEVPSCSDLLEKPLLPDRPWVFPLIWAVIFVCWLPSLVALYPGTLINDTWGQLFAYNHFLNGNILSDANPVMTTLFIGFTLNSLESITGNWHIAFFLYVLAQAAVTSFSFALTVLYSWRKLRIGTKAAVLMLCAYCFLPMYPASVQTISKDALSGWAFVLFSIQFVEIIRTEGQALAQKKTVVLLTVLALLCALTKKINPYVCLLSMLVLLFCYFRYWKKLLLSISVLAGVTLVLFQVLYSRGILIPGGKQEMLSVPFQQSARFVRDHPEEVTEEEYRVLDRVLGMEDLGQRYNPRNADPVKGFSQRAEDGEYIEYLRVWAAEGIREPVTYWKALDAMQAGWFSYTEYIPLLNMDWHNQLYPALIPEEAAYRTRSADSAAAYQQAFSDLYSSPVASFFLSYGFFAALLPSLILSLLMHGKGRKTCAAAIIPMALSLVLACYFAPVSIHFEGRRYLYPVTYTEPLILAFSFHAYREAALKRRSPDSSLRSAR